MIVLPADVYDTIEFSALAYGGIGGGALYEYEDVAQDYDRRKPFCVHGHAESAATLDEENLSYKLTLAGLTALVNDTVVFDINGRKGRPRGARVPFRPWAKRLGLVRIG